MYADELGARCPGCGSILIVGNDVNPRRREPGPCCLMLAEGLEGSPLHGKLAELAEGEEVRVLVDRTSETRTVHLVSAVPAMEPVAEEEAR